MVNYFKRRRGLPYIIKNNFGILRFLDQIVGQQFISEQDKKAIIEQFSAGEIRFPNISPEILTADWEKITKSTSSELDESSVIWDARRSIKEKALLDSLVSIDTYCRIYKRGNKLRLIHATILKYTRQCK